MNKTFKFISVITTCCLMTACAVNTSAVDPYEKFNRKVFAFNEVVDHYAIRPVALVYHKIVPQPFQNGVTNAFDNVQMIDTVANDILQFRVKYTLVDTFRLVFNSTLGIGGLFDVATAMGLPRHYEDFGLTLSYYAGGRETPYLMLPIMGPRTVSDAFGMAVDYWSRPWAYFINNFYISAAIWGGYLINTRARLLDADALIEGSFDPYIFVRSAYLQNREKLIAQNKLPYMSNSESEVSNGTDTTVTNETKPPTRSVLGVIGKRKPTTSDKALMQSAQDMNQMDNNNQQ